MLKLTLYLDAPAHGFTQKWWWRTIERIIESPLCIAWHTEETEEVKCE